MSSNNPPKRLIFNAGFNSRGRHASIEFGVPTTDYSAWRHMIERCYCPKTQKKHPTYTGCTVCPEWLDFQNFAEWYKNHKHHGIGYHLDKDLLIKGNKIYSPETCCLVPRELNALLIDCGAARGSLPIGVSFHKSSGKYQSSMRAYSKGRYLGLFCSISGAYTAYKVAKEAHVKEVANEWRSTIEPEVFDALMAWRLPTMLEMARDEIESEEA